MKSYRAWPVCVQCWILLKGSYVSHEAVVLMAPVIVIWRETALCSLGCNSPCQIIIAVISARVVKEIRSGIEAMARDHSCIGKIFGRISDTEEIHNQGSRQELPDEKDHSKHYVTRISQLAFQICLLKSQKENYLQTKMAFSYEVQEPACLLTKP